MFDIDDIQRVLDEIDYKHWSFTAVSRAGRQYLQITFDDIDHDTGLVTLQYCRKWLLSPYMTRSEIVQTAMKAVLTAEEHEVRERFRYRGHAVFGPHFDVDALVDVCEARAIDAREKDNAIELSNC